MQTRKLIFSVIFLSLLVLPVVSAYSFGGGFGYANSPLDYLNNMWVMFTIYIMFFFAIIYYTTNKSFKNPPVAAVIAASLALFIAIAMAQRNWLDSSMSVEIGAWALLVASLIAIAFTVKFAFETFGRIGSVAAILIIWFIAVALLTNTIIITIIAFIVTFIMCIISSITNIPYWWNKFN